MAENEDKKIFTRGNEALAMAAIEAGCRYYFGYPITPQGEIPEYLSRELPKVGGRFLQAESEIASINMLLGAGALGARVMTSSSGPGISLMQEGISYMAGSEIPGLIVNVSRCGPGLGGIAPSQGDYFQATRGGGHGDYRTPVLAPGSPQEMYDLAFLAFDLAFKYRTPVMILADAVIGQMKEQVVRREPLPPAPLPEWALTGADGRASRLLKSLFLAEGELEKQTLKQLDKYHEIERREPRWEEFMTEDADFIVIAFGIIARIAKSSIRMARKQGIKAGLLRPITLYPFPVEPIQKLSARVKKILVVELNTGQMVDDVRLSARPGTGIELYFRSPGAGSLPSLEEIAGEMERRFR
ncbi:MAG: 3-methyl-2-oxobutanoate dehydrogenase subunit VorB [bacterium]|nr:3-methyl-2-oxobutanoate dehydrogenase subunit VorB [bacterium]